MTKIYKAQRKAIIDCGRLLWEKDLVSACNGNISLRINQDRLLITATGTCLGFLRDKDVVLIDLNGKVLDSGSPSTENLLHRDVYKGLARAGAVVHTHNPFTNAYFLNHDVFKPVTFEAAHVLGEVFAVEQSAINVTDTIPVLERLHVSDLVVLRRHGTVAVGADLFSCLAKIQTLEEQMKTEAFGRLFAGR